VMNEREKSDSLVVPQKPPNKAEEPAAEGVEGSELAKGKTLGSNALRTQSRGGAPSTLERIRQVARKEKRRRFSALLHHAYHIDRLCAAYHALKRDAAAGVDGETWQHYGTSLESNLQDLSGRLKRGAYRAKPVRRAYIPKADGRQRPLGVPTLEDKIVQRRRRGPERNLRRGLPRFLLRISARAQPAPRIGCARGRNHEKEGGLGA
jgi:hypothetical protein